MELVSVVLPCSAFLVACWLTGRFRQYALDRQVLDVPNERSSHSVATPRGGGMAIVLTTLAAFVVAGCLDLVAWRTVWGLVGGGALVAAIGFIDDHGHLPRRWRLLGHFAAAAWVIACLGGLPPLSMWGVVLYPGWAAYAIAALYLVWLLNLTNFMDGIDGIAAVEAITVTLGGVLLYLVMAPAAREWIGPLVLAAAAFGFLVWNWPPARIFMGDAGSGFLGLMLGALSLQAAWTSPMLLWSWLILLAVFVTDATVTLVRRMLRGERVYEAHRTHAYQHAAQRWRAHRPVTLAVAGVNVFWLLPLALLVALGWLDGVVGVIVAYAPLLAIVIWLEAGLPSNDRAGDLQR